MKKYLYFLYVALFATMSLALTSCGDDDGDDEPGAGSSSGSYSTFTINGVTKYFGFKDYDWTFPELNYTSWTNTSDLQLDMSFYKTSSMLDDIYAEGGVTILFEDFDPATTTKGSALDIAEGRYTWLEISSDPHDLYGGEIYDDIQSGKVTFVSYDATKEIVTIKFEKLNMGGKVIDGTVACILTGNAVVSSH